MTYRGVYRDGIVILHGDVDLQNGATVEVNAAQPAKSKARRETKSSAKPSAPARKSRAKKSAAHPLPGFGAWKNRTDITDTAAFARDLRRRVSTRGSKG